MLLNKAARPPPGDRASFWAGATGSVAKRHVGDDMGEGPLGLGGDHRVRSAEIDKGLIAGAVIKAGDLVIDGSAKGRLDKLTSVLNK